MFIGFDKNNTRSRMRLVRVTYPVVRAKRHHHKLVRDKINVVNKLPILRLSVLHNQLTVCGCTKALVQLPQRIPCIAGDSAARKYERLGNNTTIQNMFIVCLFQLFYIRSLMNFGSLRIVL